MLPALAPPPLLTTEAVAHAAEVHVRRGRQRAEPLAWEDPPEAPRVDGGVAVPAEVVALVADLAAVARAREAVPLAGLIPRRDTGESIEPQMLHSFALPLSS
jgi:hypothetical protein